MHSIRVQKLASQRRGMPQGLARQQLDKEVRRARKALNAAIWSWRRRNENGPQA